ncbi:DNA replication complex GINS protein, putative [Plasmodium vivax]|nr:DNA replication complex GINS protein, putative [Plasmodium vivax]
MDDVFNIFIKKNKTKKRASTGAGKEEGQNEGKKKLFNYNRKNPRRAHNEEDTYNNYQVNKNSRSKDNNANKNIENIVLVDFPPLPLKKVEACVSFYYLQYLRNQLIYGNKNIKMDENAKMVGESLLDRIENTIYEYENDSTEEDNYKKEIKIVTFKSIYDRFYKILTTLTSYAEGIPMPNNLYEYVLNNGVYVRSKKNTDYNSRENIHNVYSYLDNVDVGENDLSFNDEKIYIDSIDISRPTILNRTLINEDIDIEYLPLKLNSAYHYNNIQYAKLFLNDAVNMSLYDRALGELVVVKALVDIPPLPTAFVEGFDIREMKAGERQWMPIYLAITLSSFTYVDVEFPFWFYIKNFINIKEEEYKKQSELFELPSPYFFEICFMFIDQKVFSKVTPIETVGQKSYFKYMSKVAGYVEDIKHCRTEKIIRHLEEQNVHSSHIYIPNLQHSETHLINLTLYSFWKYDKGLNEKANSIDFTSYLLEPFIKDEEDEKDANLLQDL